MTTPCANCGSPITEDDERCPHCDALAPLRDDDATRIEPAAAAASAPPAPWAIPMRDPEAPAEHHGASRRTAAFVGLGVLVFLLTVVVGGAALRGGDDPDSSTEEAASVSEATTTTTVAEAASTSSSTSAPSTTDTSDPAAAEADNDDTDDTDATTATTTTTTHPTAAAAASSRDTGSVPALSSSFSGGWIAQLTSVPVSAGTDALEAAWRQLGADRDIVAAHSGDWSGFRTGYWVLVVAGPFASADDAQAHCTASGRTDRDECLPRELVRR